MGTELPFTSVRPRSPLQELAGVPKKLKIIEQGNAMKTRSVIIAERWNIEEMTLAVDEVRLAARVALITGVSRSVGIGAATARELDHAVEAFSSRIIVPYDRRKRKHEQ